ncbi:MAG: TrkH family potassium uptake protein [Elusimicrobiales bacterium]|nr:TrkH family potassium uptake protein [Elusimicrobiales bacterium]
MNHTDNAAGMKTLARDIGGLQLLLSAGMLAALAVSLIFGEYFTALALFASAAISAGCGGWAWRHFRNAPEPERHHAMMIAGAGWLVSAVFGALPFLLAAYWTPEAAARAFVPAGQDYASSLFFFRNPLHSFFESMSAYTATGLTMAVHEPSIGRGLLFYRSVCQWLGGAGVVILSLALLPRPRLANEIELFRSELAVTKLRPGIIGTARETWKIYALVTGAAALWLFVSTLVFLPGYGFVNSLFDAVNHAMTGLAAGGFSVLDDSIAGYGSYALELAHIPPMILSAISLPLYYFFLRERSLRVFWRDPQFRLMSLLLPCGSLAAVLLLWGVPAVGDPLREGIFQFISALTTTGWQTSDIGNWKNSAVMFFAFVPMLIGGSAGAPVGGFKLIRVYLISRAVVWRVRRVFLPESVVLPLRTGDRTLSPDAMKREVHDAAVFCLVYLAVLAAAIIVVAHYAGPGFTLADILFECVSTQGNVGLSSGLTAPDMPVVIELTLMLQMWVGRLEIFPVVILFSALATRAFRR